MDALSALARLAPYGLGPIAGAYGAYRGSRAVSKLTRRTKPMRRIPRGINVKGLHTFKRAINFIVPYSPLNGIVGVAGGLDNRFSLTFGLDQIVLLVGAVRSGYAVPNFTELTALFDKWRIKGVTVSVFFQDNSSSTGVTATNMPLLNYVWDTSDNSLESIAEMNQHPNVKRQQFGSGSTRTGCIRTSGRPLTHLNTGDSISGGLASTGSRPEKYGTWIDTVSPSTSFYALKGVFDPLGATQVVSQGSMSFYIDITYELKDVI